MRLLTFLAFTAILTNSVFSQFSYNQLINYRLKEMNYAIKPEHSDTSCKQQIDNVNEEIKMQKKIFCMPANRNYRFKNELSSVLNPKGYKVFWDTIPMGIDEEIESSPDCYCAQWINHNIKTEGSDFRKEVFKAADKKYVQRVKENNEVVNTWHLDERPFIKETNENQKYYSYFVTKQDSLCSRKKQWIDVRFVIEKDASITNLVPHLDFRHQHIKPACVNHLLGFIENQLKLDKWQPGKLHGENVRTQHTARLYLHVKK